LQIFIPTNNYTVNQIKYFHIKLLILFGRKSQFTFTNCEENYIIIFKIVSWFSL